MGGGGGGGVGMCGEGGLVVRFYGYIAMECRGGAGLTFVMPRCEMIDYIVVMPPML